MNQHFTSVDEILFGALKIETAAARATYLDKACGSNSELRKRVEHLLDSYREAGGFMESPAADLGITAEGTVLTEQTGSWIGPFKIREQIGEGGFGTVFVAEQEKPVTRKVALKVFKPGMDTHAVVARFEAERQALALMDHPNIARVLDAGATEHGRPYFVMELVKGTSITDFCDTQKLVTRERLQLFVEVCRAMQHAHQKGIIHRDIKPSNVMVTMHDERAVPKVIDRFDQLQCHLSTNRFHLLGDPNRPHAPPPICSNRPAIGGVRAAQAAVARVMSRMPPRSLSSC